MLPLCINKQKGNQWGLLTNQHFLEMNMNDNAVIYV